MIKNTKSLSMIEASKYIKKTGEESDPNEFIKKFSKLNVKKAEELRKSIEELGLIKVNEKNISKIIDLVPEETEDLDKIFIDVSLDENEKNKILETIKKIR